MNVSLNSWAKRGIPVFWSTQSKSLAIPRL